MGVNLHMTIDKIKFDLGRSHQYIDLMRSGPFNVDREDLYSELSSYRGDMAKRITALAAHHPTFKELEEICEEVDHMLEHFTEDILRIGRCMVLNELKENHDVEFEVQ